MSKERKGKYQLTCPECNGNVDASDKYCRHCGFSFIKAMQKEVDSVRIWRPSDGVHPLQNLGEC